VTHRSASQTTNRTSLIAICPSSITSLRPRANSSHFLHPRVRHFTARQSVTVWAAIPGLATGGARQPEYREIHNNITQQRYTTTIHNKKSIHNSNFNTQQNSIHYSSTQKKSIHNSNTQQNCNKQQNCITQQNCNKQQNCNTQQNIFSFVCFFLVFPDLQARGGEGALAPSCCLSQGHNQISNIVSVMSLFCDFCCF